jgi:hypothetical protein
MQLDTKRKRKAESPKQSSSDQPRQRDYVVFTEDETRPAPLKEKRRDNKLASGSAVDPINLDADPEPSSSRRIAIALSPSADGRERKTGTRETAARPASVEHGVIAETDSDEDLFFKPWKAA